MATVPDQVTQLVERFDRNRDAYVSAGYNEAQLRHEFLEPFFEALGWDVSNRQGSAMPYRDVTRIVYSMQYTAHREVSANG